MCVDETGIFHNMYAGAVTWTGHEGIEFMAKPILTANQSDVHYLCVFSSRPFDECFCRNLTGRTVSNIAMYCMDRYQECPVYQKQVLLEAEINATSKNKKNGGTK